MKSHPYSTLSNLSQPELPHPGLRTPRASEILQRLAREAKLTNICSQFAQKTPFQKSASVFLLDLVSLQLQSNFFIYFVLNTVLAQASHSTVMLRIQHVTTML